MHWHVIAHRNDFAVTVEDRTGVVATLLDIWRKRSAAQRGTHLFRNRVIEVFENLEFNRVAHGKKSLLRDGRRTEQQGSTSKSY